MSTTTEEINMSGYLVKAAESAIKDFPFWDYGMDDVDPKSKYAEWVPALADAVVAAVVKANRVERGGKVGLVLGGSSSVASAETGGGS